MQSILGTDGYPQLIRVVRYVRSRWRLRNVLKGSRFDLFSLVAFAVLLTGWSTSAAALVGSGCSGGTTSTSPPLSAVIYCPLEEGHRQQVARYMEEHDRSEGHPDCGRRPGAAGTGGGSSPAHG
jgi:hypothetical protein